jgi:hypothetical protein
MPSSFSSAKPSASRASSSAYIQSLQRASFGIGTLSGGKTPITDDDIAELIADEAKEKERIWKEFGLGVYNP